MINRYPALYNVLWISGGTLILIALAFPSWLGQMELPLALALILLIGLPHGATDHLLFRQLMRNAGRQQSLPAFYAGYLGLVAVYGLMWWLFPWLALAIFLLISMYHFGQSNWNYLDARAWLLHCSWGAFVLLTPIVWHYEASKPVIESMVREAIPAIPQVWKISITAGLLLLNQGLILLKIRDRSLLVREGIQESLNLWVLGGMFISTPLMLGFAVYFAGWHALSSSLDQIRFFREQRNGYRWSDYMREALPFTLLALAGLGALYLALRTQEQETISLGPVFMFIASVTLPHMLLIDQIYERSALDSGIK